MIYFYDIDAVHFNRTNPGVKLTENRLKLVETTDNTIFSIVEFDENGYAGSSTAHVNLFNKMDKRPMNKELFLSLISDGNKNLKTAIHIASYLGYSKTNAAMDQANLSTADAFLTISPEGGLQNYAQVRKNMADFFSKRFGW